jgi:hypothetical protein
MLAGLQALQAVNKMLQISYFSNLSGELIEQIKNLAINGSKEATLFLELGERQNGIKMSIVSYQA